MNTQETPETLKMEDAKIMVETAFIDLGLSSPVWRACESSITPWAFTDLDFGGFKDFSVGVSSGGVVSVDGSSFTPTGKMNISLDRVLESIRAKLIRLGITGGN